MEREEVRHNNWTVDGNRVKDAKSPDKDEVLGNMGEIVVGKRLEEFFSEVSVVGLKYVVLTGAMYVRKAIWLLFVLGGLGFMIYQFYDRISYFLSNPTTVKVTVKTMEQPDFPTVTICNENFVSKTFADYFPGLTELIYNIYPPWPEDGFEPNFDTLRYVEYALNITDWGELWMRGSPFFDPYMWPYCTFKGALCNMAEIQLVPTEMGFCVQFNGENVNYTATKPGQNQGLLFLLNISQNDYLYAQSRMAGVRVAVHEKHELPSFNQYSIKAGPGQITSIGLNKRIISDLPHPYTNCSDEEGYSSYECENSCFENYIIEKCGCRIYYFTVSGYPTCDPLDMYNCTDPNIADFDNNNLSEDLCDCPKQCERTKYIYTISSAAISQYSLKKGAEEEYRDLHCPETRTCNMDQEFVDALTAGFKRDILEVEVYFQDLSVEEVVTQKGYTILALLCDIGGALGLILGATILTVFEIIDFGVVLLYDFIRYKIALRNNKKLDSKDKK